MGSSRKAGFTLIELLVTISVVSMLAGLIIVSASAARRVARDRKRAADLKTIATTIRAYQSENANALPPTTGGGGGCQGRWGCSFNSSFLETLVTGARTYFNFIPTDPTHPGHSYFYMYRAFSGSGMRFGCQRPFYALVAHMETEANSEAVSDTNCWTSAAVPNDNSSYILIGR